MKLKSKISWYVIIIAFLPAFSYAQLGVSSASANQLVQSLLGAGSGITISNVTSSGSVGSFYGGGGAIGINNGVILTTGPLNIALGPNDQAGAGGDNGSGGDNQLSQLAGGGATYNTSVIEFDFSSTNDRISFRYAFASEEYDEFVCSNFNDVFGFFISGPGANGNIALVPGTGNPVAINFINNGSAGSAGGGGYCELNKSYLYRSIPTGSSLMQFDGATVVLEAKATIRPCETYHMKIAIADVGDAILDSGVFLEAGSFDSPSPAVSAGPDVTACSGIGTKIGGTPVSGYNYSWSPSQGLDNIYAANPTVNLTNTSGGPTYMTYTVTAFYGSSSQCTVKDEVTVRVNPSPSSAFTVTSPLCVGGTSTITYTGGVSNAYYDWDFKGGVVLSGSGRGPYVVRFDNPGTKNIKLSVDKDYCYSVTNVPITVHPAPNPSFTVPPVCLGQTSNINATGTPGTIATWNWNFGDGTATPAGTALEYHTYSAPGNYIVTLTATDNNGCSRTITQSAIVNDAPNAATNSVASGCLTNDGQGQVAAFGGSGSGYTYLWDDANAQTTAFATGLSPGTYNVIINDPNGCSVTKTIKVGNLNGNSGSVVTKNVTCKGGTDGAIKVFPTGGTPPYDILWTSIGSTSDTISGLAAGSYPIVVTDAIGCSIRATITITEPGGIGGALPKQHVSCTGGSDGTATAIPAGGINPYVYLYSNGQTTPTATGLSAGIYTVTVHDARGCSVSAQFTITEPVPLALSKSTLAATCFWGNNGTATITPSGGTAPYYYSWNDKLSQDSSTATGLSRGIYEVSVTDSKGCSLNDTIQVSSPPDFTIANLYLPSHCGKSDGAAGAKVTGATPGYTYSWTVNGSTNWAVFNLPAGSYPVLITDNNGCDTTATVEIKEADNIFSAVIASKNNIRCNGTGDGRIEVVGVGGIGNYTYSWNDGTTNNIVSGLKAGTYSVVVTDSVGCTAITTTVITEPSEFTVIPSYTIPKCELPNGAIKITTTGGTPSLLTGYAYSWSPTGGATDSISGLTDGIYYVTVRDSNNCDTTVALTLVPGNRLPEITVDTIIHITCNGVANGEAAVSGSLGNGGYAYSWLPGDYKDSVLTGLAPANYTVTLTDVLGCTAVAQVLVTEPEMMKIELNKPDTICIGDSTWITTTVTGGILPYTYSWSISAINNDSVKVAPDVTTTYSVTVEDANHCLLPVNQTTVPVYTPLSYDISQPGAFCIGNSIPLSVSVSGGDRRYTYTWLPTESIKGTGATVTATPTVTTNYTVTFSDGCLIPLKDSIAVTVYPLPVVNPIASDTSGCPELCTKFNNELTIPGDYHWIFGDGTIETTTGNTAHCYANPGVYTLQLEITDTNGCKNTSTRNDYIEVYFNAIANFNVDEKEITIVNPLVHFSNTSQYANSWQWNFGDSLAPFSTEEHPSFAYPDTGRYLVTLIADNEHHCADTISKPVYIKNDATVYIPNAFTPNGDGKNDLFFASGVGIVEKELWIYDRWGMEIFHTKDIYGGWNGRVNGELSNAVVQQDTYVYVYIVKNHFLKSQRLVGHVSVIR